MVSFATLFVLLHAFGASVAVQATVVDVPLVMRADRDYLPTSVLLRCEAIPYDSSFGEFRSRNLSPEEEFFVRVVDAARKVDFEAARQVSKWTGSEAELRAIVEGYAKLLGLFEDIDRELVLYHQYLVGDLHVFVWGGESVGPQAMALRRSFLVESDEEGGLLWRARYDDQVSVLLTNSLHRLAEIQQGPLAPQERAFQYVFPGTEASPVWLLFDGRDVSAAVDELELPMGDSLRFQRMLREMIERREVAPVGPMMSDKSREKFVSWAASLSTQEYDAFCEEYLRSREEVMFVLDAGPLDVLVYRDAGTGKRVYDYVDMRGATPKLTNFFFQGVVDDFLQDAVLFAQPLDALTASLEAPDQVIAKLPVLPGRSAVETHTPGDRGFNQTTLVLVLLGAIVLVGSLVILRKQRKRIIS